MKEKVKSQKSLNERDISSNQKIEKDLSQIDTSMKSHNSSSNQPNNSNIILNQNGVPCYNNINIYTNGVKQSDINLRHLIFNKMTKKPGEKVSKLYKNGLN